MKTTTDFFAIRVQKAIDKLACTNKLVKKYPIKDDSDQLTDEQDDFAHLMGYVMEEAEKDLELSNHEG